MTLTDLLSELAKYTKQYGVQAHATDAEIKGVVGRRLKLLTARTRCLFSDEITFTPTASTAKYAMDTESAVFTAPLSGNPQVSIVECRSVILNGKPILDDNGQPGPTTLDDLEMRAFQWQDTTQYPTAEPVRWLVYPKGTLRLWPAPNSASFGTGPNYIHAWYRHPLIDSNSSGSTVIHVPEDMHELMFSFITEKLLEPYRSGDGAKAWAEISARNEAEIQRFTAQYMAQFQRQSGRGDYKRKYFNIGW